MAFTVTSVVRVGDSITITGTDGNGNTLTAQGWQSALDNYYPPASYNADGTLKAGATPRAMTAAEKQAYWKNLLGLTAPVAPTQVYP